MSEQFQSGEEDINEEGQNPTQERIDSEGGGEEKPVDASWREDDWGETEASPHQGEEGQEIA